MRAFCLVGVRGSGKTAMVRAVLPKVPQFAYVSTDTVLRSLVGPRYEEFDLFPDVIKKQFRSRAIMYLKEESARSHRQLIVEDHASLYNPNTRRIERVLPEEASFFYTDLILHQVDPRTVLARRREKRMDRRYLDLDEIKKEVATEEAEARRFADSGGLDLHVIPDSGGLEGAMRLLRILQGY